MDASALDSALKYSLELSLPGKKPATSGSVAVSKSGALYPAGLIGTESHIQNIPSELAALVRAVHANDVAVEQMHTIVTDPAILVSPVILKTLVDHSARTGIAIHYIIRDTAGHVLFEIADARDAVPYYQRTHAVLVSLADRILEPAKTKVERIGNSELQLRERALAGCMRNFLTRDGTSGYGAAVLTASGTIYFGGQYSSFDQWTGVHAEMGVLANALMDGARDITHIGIASSKFVDTPCSPCGCCRQFIAEMARAYNFSPTLCLFASGNEQFTSFTIDELLPVQWSSKK